MPAAVWLTEWKAILYSGIFFHFQGGVDVSRSTQFGQVTFFLLFFPRLKIYISDKQAAMGDIKLSHVH